MEGQLEKLKGCCAARDVEELVGGLEGTVPEYTPSAALRKRTVAHGAGAD